MDSAVAYLRTLSPLAASRLYSQPWAALVITRALPPLAQQCALRMAAMPIGSSVASSELKGWFQRDKMSQRRLAGVVEVLLNIRFLVKAGKGQVQLDHGTHKALQACLCQNQLTPRAARTYTGGSEDAVKPSGIDTWEDLLLFMVGVPGATPPSGTFRSILVRKGLLSEHDPPGPAHSSESDESDEERTFELTSVGFQFLLSSVAAQVWSVLLGYIDSVNQAADEILSLLFALAVLPNGQGLRCSRSALHSSRCCPRYKSSDWLLVFQAKTSWCRHTSCNRYATSISRRSTPNSDM